MYLSGIVGVVVILLSVLMMLGIIGLDGKIVGGMFLAICVGMAGPFLDRGGLRA